MQTWARPFVINGGQIPRSSKAVPFFIGIRPEPASPSHKARQTRITSKVRCDGALEITYGRRGARKKSIDWFLVLPDLVVLFEVKSSRMSLSARAGDDGLLPQLQRTVQHAVQQIDTTEQQLRQSAPEFADIATDRPRVGVVVTAEPHYGVNSPWAQAIIGEASIPTFVCSLLELERLVTLTPDRFAEAMRRLTAVHDLGGALSKIQDLEPGRNAIIDAAWESFSWVAKLGSADSE